MRVGSIMSSLSLWSGRCGTLRQAQDALSGTVRLMRAGDSITRLSIWPIPVGRRR